jgi:hypothetical protein
MASLQRLTFLGNQPFIDLLTSKADFGLNSATGHFVRKADLRAKRSE